MSQLKTEEYRLLPNSRWLQKLLEHQVAVLGHMMDEEWQKAVNAEPEYIQEKKTNLGILTNIFEQCKKTGIGKPISLTKIEWDDMHNILEDIRVMGYYFKTEYWNERTKFFDIDPYWKNIHSINKYIDLFESGAFQFGSSQEQWMQCVEGVCDCSEEDIMHMDSLEPSVVTPPTISGRNVPK
jgi:hypothetical protein